MGTSGARVRGVAGVGFKGQRTGKRVNRVVDLEKKRGVEGRRGEGSWGRELGRGEVGEQLRA